MNDKHYVACDLGAESGRLIAGQICDGKLAFEEIHRFPNGPINVDDSLHWDVTKIFDELKIGLQKVADQNLNVASISVDTWGVDYVLVGDDGEMLGQPFNYRDARTDSIFSAAVEQAGRNLIFAETGIQFMQINTLYQLIAENQNEPERLRSAKFFLTIADYFNYRLSGVPSIEESLASTTQLFNPISKQWSIKLCEVFDLPKHVFPPTCSSGTKLGMLLPELVIAPSFSDTQVIASCSHDTAAAVAAVPAKQSQDWAFLSSGTWSLIGVELDHPLLTDEARELDFTNEAGFGGTTRFLKNIIGLWILQECRREWSEAGEHLDYDDLSQLAEQAEPLRSLINPNDPRFLKPDGMPERIVQFCRETKQPEPETPGQFARCILESLALLYKKKLDALEQLTGRKIETLHIVGGGSNSSLLNKFTANASGRTVVAGPVEATAIGNLLIQAIALGDLNSLAELREVVRNSTELKTFQPRQSIDWHAASVRFSKLESF